MTASVVQEGNTDNQCVAPVFNLQEQMDILEHALDALDRYEPEEAALGKRAVLILRLGK